MNEEQIKKAWESAFKNIAESIDSERTKEEIAAMFFELGWKAGIEYEHSCIAAAIHVMNTIKIK
jgi:ubiquinone/menaquinone biosynthesis C-methylase UbiE